MSSSRKIVSDSGAVFILLLMAIPLLGELARSCTYARANVPLESRQLVALFLYLCVVTVGLLYFGTNTFHRNQHRGPLDEVSDWPDPIQFFYTSLKDTGVDTESFSVYLIEGKPGRTLSTAVCRLNVDDEGWAAIEAKLELHRISESDGEALRKSIVSRSDESWWPLPSESVEYFAGEKEDPYTAARDKASSRAFIYYECKA